MNERDAYVQKMKAKLDEWNADIDKLEAQTSKVQADAKLRYEKQLTELKSNRDAAAQKLRELQDASVDAWEAMRRGTEAAWADMAKAFREAAERFK